MLEMRECWINIYQSPFGQILGCQQPSRERAVQAISSGFAKLVYRIHVRLR